MPASRWTDLLLLIATLQIKSAATFRNTETELTVEVKPGQEECFYLESVQPGSTIDVEYQVIDGGHSNDLTMDFRLTGPNGVPIVAHYGKSDSSLRHTAHTLGDYKFCFGNANGRFSSKVVFFSVDVEDADADHDEDVVVSEDGNGQGELFDMEASLATIHERMGRSRHLQDQLRAFEFRDRSVAEHNFERVNFMSGLQVVVMVIAGLVQVLLLRSLLDDKSAMHKLWRMRN